MSTLRIQGIKNVHIFAGVFTGTFSTFLYQPPELYKVKEDTVPNSCGKWYVSLPSVIVWVMVIIMLVDKQFFWGFLADICLCFVGKIKLFPYGHIVHIFWVNAGLQTKPAYSLQKFLCPLWMKHYKIIKSTGTVTQTPQGNGKERWIKKRKGTFGSSGLINSVFTVH